MRSPFWTDCRVRLLVFLSSHPLSAGLGNKRNPRLVTTKPNGVGQSIGNGSAIASNDALVSPPPISRTSKQGLDPGLVVRSDRSCTQAALHIAVPVHGDPSLAPASMEERSGAEPDRQ